MSIISFADRVIATPIVLLIAAHLLSGCLASQIPPVNKFAGEMLGEPVETVVKMNNATQSYASRIGWIENKYTLENGNWIYVTPIRHDCLVHWEVSPSGIIVGYKTEGGQCH